MRDQEIIRSFAGRERVSLTVDRTPARVVAIAHEYGYTLDDYLMTVSPTRQRLRFVRRRVSRTAAPRPARQATSGRVIRGDRACRARSGPVRGGVDQVAVAVRVVVSTVSRTRCGVVMT